MVAHRVSLVAIVAQGHAGRIRGLLAHATITARVGCLDLMGGPAGCTGKRADPGEVLAIADRTAAGAAPRRSAFRPATVYEVDQIYCPHVWYPVQFGHSQVTPGTAELMT